jgi:hypothetical protein
LLGLFRGAAMNWVTELFQLSRGLVEFGARTDFEGDNLIGRIAVKIAKRMFA